MSALLEKARTTVGAFLAERFPDAIDYGDGSYTISHGSSSVMIVVRPYTETDTMVELISQIVTGAKIDEAVLRWMLRKNAELHFGAFGLLFDDTIIFSYSLPGNSLDAGELESAITSVAVIADHYDDIIVNMAGAKRVADLEMN